MRRRKPHGSRATSRHGRPRGKKRRRKKHSSSENDDDGEEVEVHKNDRPVLQPVAEGVSESDLHSIVHELATDNPGVDPELLLQMAKVHQGSQEPAPVKPAKPASRLQRSLLNKAKSWTARTDRGDAASEAVAQMRQRSRSVRHGSLSHGLLRKSELTREQVRARQQLKSKQHHARERARKLATNGPNEKKNKLSGLKGSTLRQLSGTTM